MVDFAAHFTIHATKIGFKWGKDRITLFEIHSCIYRRDFAYPVRKTSPIYIGKHGYKQCTPTPTGLPIYTGGILRTPTQNLSYICCPYIQEGFCIPLRKTSPIYKIHHM